MANVAWRCEHPNGDVKYAAIRTHSEKLEDKGYVCELDPDATFTTDQLYTPIEE